MLIRAHNRVARGIPPVVRLCSASTGDVRILLSSSHIGFDAAADKPKVFQHAPLTKVGQAINFVEWRTVV